MIKTLNKKNILRITSCLALLFCFSISAEAGQWEKSLKPAMLEQLLSLAGIESQEDIKEKIKQAKENGNYSFKTIHKRKDGSTFLVYENFQFIKDKNAFRCIVKEDYSPK